MFFTSLNLFNFKNYASRAFRFDKRIVGVCGSNGRGKTNLLDALYYLCFTKSYFNRTDQTNILFGSEGFRLEGTVSTPLENDVKITCVCRSNSKKEFLLDGISYTKFSAHIGKFPVVFIAPDDISLINGASAERRKFLDTVISQNDPEYLNSLITYSKLLSQRNGLFKYEAGRSRRDDILLASIDERLIRTGSEIHRKRKVFCTHFFPLIQRLYGFISDTGEDVTITYESQLHDKEFAMLLKEFSEKDRLSQRTNTGVHRDDILFNLADNPFRSVASQGQKKSLLFACKLAEFEFLKAEKKEPPVLLLDDVFEKLDEERVRNLLKYIIGKNDGQVFITDTHEDRLRETISGYTSDFQIIRLD